MVSPTLRSSFISFSSLFKQYFIELNHKEAINDQLNKSTRTPFNLVYIYCLLTLLSLNITRCTGLIVGEVDLRSFFRPSVIPRASPDL